MKKKLKLAGLIISILGLIVGFYYLQLSSEKTLPTKQIGKNQKKLAKILMEEHPIQIDTAINPEKAFERQVSEMSLEEKVGQLFLARVPETNQLEDLTRYHLGGYLLFSRDIAGESQSSLKKKIASYQKVTELPLIIASDEEGGVVSRLSYEKNFLKKPFRSPQKVYSDGGLVEIKKELAYQASVLKDLGISMSLSPVADVSTNPNSFIYERTLGKNSDETARYIETAVKEMNKLGIGSTLKHFPGYGDNLDSHLEIVRDKRSLADLKKEALPPFIKGIKAGADSVLITHNIINALDDKHPASVSSNVYDYLRNELEFEGVIMTDDFDMAGLKEFTTQEEAAISAINNSADLILSSSYHTQIPAVVKAIKDKKISIKKIDKSVTRILLLKYHLKLIDIK